MTEQDYLLASNAARLFVLQEVLRSLRAHRNPAIPEREAQQVTATIERWLTATMRQITIHRDGDG